MGAYTKIENQIRETYADKWNNHLSNVHMALVGTLKDGRKIYSIFSTSEDAAPAQDIAVSETGDVIECEVKLPAWYLKVLFAPAIEE